MAPSVNLIHKPREISNERTAQFHFNCLNEVYCRFTCVVFAMEEMPLYKTCQSPYEVENLTDGSSYIFSIYATDNIANIGPTKNYTWKIGKFGTHLIFCSCKHKVK